MLSFGLRLSKKISSLTGLTISNVPEKTTIESKEEREKEKGWVGTMWGKKKKIRSKACLQESKQVSEYSFQDDGFV